MGRSDRTRADVARLLEGVRAFLEFSRNPGCHPPGEHEFNTHFCPGCGRAKLFCVTKPLEPTLKLVYDVTRSKFVDVDPKEHTELNVYGSHFPIDSDFGWFKNPLKNDYPVVWVKTLEWLLEKMPEDEKEFAEAVFGGAGWVSHMNVGMMAAVKEKPWCGCFEPYNVAVCYDCILWFVECAMCRETYRGYPREYDYYDFVYDHADKMGHTVLDDDFRSFFITTMMGHDPVLFCFRPIQELQRVLWWLSGNDEPHHFWHRPLRDDLWRVRVPSPNLNPQTTAGSG